MRIIKATSEHIEWIVRHRIEMFRTIGRSDEELAEMAKVVRDYLHSSWNDEELVCHLILVDNNIVGGCAVVFFKSLPTHKNPSGIRAFIQNLFVEPEYRGKGLGTKLLENAIETCRKKGAWRVSLNATEMGKSIYIKLGFDKRENHYRLKLE